MANEEQLSILKQGVEVWNRWRKKEPDRKIDLMGSDLSGIDLRRGQLDLFGVDLRRANLFGANLSKAKLFGAALDRANLSRANLSSADFSYATLRGANLRGANLSLTHLIAADFTGADLSQATLFEADLRAARLSRANLSNTDLTATNFTGATLAEADLRGSDLTYSNFVGTNISNAKMSNSRVYGINVWDLGGEFQEQKDLIINPERTPGLRPIITVDNIKVAQFIYLILNNEEIRDVINTLTSKTVLILGRFAIPERKAILDALRDKLREYDLLPIVFDFDRPTDKDFTETIKTLAGLSYFVIADITNPKSSPLELQATVPDYQIPFVPIIQEGESPFAMMVDLQKKYDWVLETRSYDSIETLMKALKPGIIDPAIKLHYELRLKKAKAQNIHPLQDFIDK